MVGVITNVVGVFGYIFLCIVSYVFDVIKSSLVDESSVFYQAQIPMSL